MECQFSFTVFLIYQRLQIINNLLNETSSKVNVQTRKEYSKLTFMKDVQIVKTKQLPASVILKKIETLMQVHDSIVDAASDLNDIYSFQILICLSVMFIKTVFAVFFSYFELLVLGKTEFFLNWFFWIVIDWNEILLITVTCHLATGQSQQTGIEVHKMLMNSQDSTVRDKLMVFSQQIFHRPIDFTACGLFSINAELIFTILGSATTYLLIMLQFQEGNEANCIIANSTVQ
ncbi:hypothetical protein ILUMI_16288 [Ignelater luminosus]|uniref:Gustatory receptor n=1 Tax=Ignelater luminosus TaxID=2038154 RepID=A0A8K0CUQ7_IGNLU|nr:hypothetical protein ILUMI_16288 [Ignelater luminosus]